MHYLALGDSISIDDYTGVVGGGAASQFARRVEATRFRDLTLDGQIARGVLDQLKALRTDTPIDVCTLTIGGNDLLMGSVAEDVVPIIEACAARLENLVTTVIINTIYDPSDGSDDKLTADAIGILFEPAVMRRRFNAMNAGIRAVGGAHGFILSDLEALFHGHGALADDSWFVLGIEPNLAGATAIADHWAKILGKQGT